MPLRSGSDANTISANIRELYHHGSKPRSKAQIVAIAMSNARKTGFKKPGMPKKVKVRSESEMGADES